MTKFMKGSGSFLTGLTIMSVLIFSGCEDPGSIGGQFYDSSKVQVDTLLVDGFTTERFNAYTGGVDAATSSLGGSVSDPVYGDLEFQTLLKLNANRQASIDRIDDSFILKLRMVVDTTYRWGNIDENFGYTIYENTQFWRGATLQSEDQIGFDNSTPVANFTRDDFKEGRYYEVELSEEYSDKFLSFYNDDSAENDSLWNFGEYGFSIIPDPSSNVVESFRFGVSDLIVIDSFADDTSTLIMQDWGYLSETTNQPVYTDKTVLSNSLDNVLKINLTDAINTIQTDNIVSAELVFYEDTTQLVNSQGPDFLRPETLILNAQVELGEYPEITLQLDNAAFNGFKDDSGAFRFNISFYVNDVIYAGFQGEDFYIYPAFRSGNLTNTILFNEQSPGLSPRLIVTSIVEE